MIFTKELLLKGLAGVSLCAGVAGLGIHIYKSGEVKITDPQGQLGLPEGCNLPTNNTPATCNITAENISKINDIKFDGKTANQNPTFSGTGSSLQISIAKSDDTNFPHGYKFTLTPNGENLTITRGETAGGNIVINNGKSSDFKVKKTESGFALEEAFTLNTLTNKLADFTCTNGECQIGSTAISIKQGNHTESKTKNASQTGTPGKIKVYSGEEDYNKGFKFVIEEGDIDLSSTSGTNVTKFEQFETYEIKKEGDTWSLVRKHKAIDEVKKALGLSTGSSDCPENTGIFECSLDTAEKLKAVNFDGKSEDPTVSDNNYSEIKLKISKTTETNREKFPHGFKFVLESNKEITALAIKANTNTEFKIKKTGEGKSAVLTLEKAWTVEELAAKVGLTGCTTTASPKQCDFGSSSINVYDTASSYVTGASLANGSTGKKMTYEEGMEGYNQGIKFYIPHSEAADISITGGTTTGTSITTISKETTEGTGPSYEIKEEGGTWYLAKKTTVSG